MTIVQPNKKYTVDELCNMIRQASPTELAQLKKLIPAATKEQIEDAHKRFDDGIYDEEGTLIGELHPDD